MELFLEATIETEVCTPMGPLEVEKLEAEKGPFEAEVDICKIFFAEF